MKKILFYLFAGFVLVSCSDSRETMKCGDYEVKVSISEDMLDATINGDSVILTQSESASGVRYVGSLNDTGVVLWNKGHDWMLILNDEEPIMCQK